MPGLPALREPILALLEDRQGNLWTGGRAGLVRINSAGGRFFGAEEGLFGGAVRAPVAEPRLAVVAEVVEQAPVLRARERELNAELAKARQSGTATAERAKDLEQQLRQRAAELDPLSPQILIDATMPYLFRKDTASAIALTRRAAALDTTYFFPVMVEGWAHLETGQYERAIPLIQKASTMYAPPFVTAYLAFAQGMAGHRDAALKQIAVLEKLSPGGKVLPFNLALVYLGVGDLARAIDYLEKAYDADSQLLAWLGQDAMFDSLRSEPRFTALLRKLNFVK